MKNWKIVPKVESVLRYVECYWFLEKEPDDPGPIHPKLNPDPSSHLIIANHNHVSQYDYDDTSQSTRGSHWIFPHLKTQTMNHSRPFRIVGIKFRVGALYSLNLNDLGSRLNKIEAINISQLLGSEPFDAAQLLLSAFEQKHQVGNRLDDALSTWVLTSHEDKHSELVRQILSLLSNRPIAEIGERLHRSQRTIERSFMRVTGLTMKQCQAMVRLEEILNYLYQLDEEEINWADVANKYHFSDQPHLVRHLKNFIGRTPAEYAQKRDLTIDIYGNFEFN